MKLPENNIYTELDGELKSFDFNLDLEDQGLIFDMLRKKIYEDPIGTVIREIASNARDANRENNNDNKIKIIIHDNKNIFEDGESRIEIKDDGVGISPDRIESIFVKYGKSTKRDSNNYTGGFGIGGKTPFSYKDVFNITTVFDSVKYEYVAFIDESKKGKLVLQTQEKTDLNSGTSIIIPIANQDIKNFEIKSVYYTYLWQNQPEYIGFKTSYENLINVLYDDSEITILQNAAYKVYKTSYNYSNVYLYPDIIALIDGIPYPIKHASVLFKNINFNNTTLVLKFNNGDLSISTNRENLHYDDSTIAILNNKFNSIISKFIKLFDAIFIKSYLDNCIAYTDLFNETNYKSYFYTFLKEHSQLDKTNLISLNLKTNFEFETISFKHYNFNLRYPKQLTPKEIDLGAFYLCKEKMLEIKSRTISNSIDDYLVVIKKIPYSVYYNKTKYRPLEEQDYIKLQEEEYNLLNSLKTILDYDSVEVVKPKKEIIKKDYIEIKYKKIRNVDYYSPVETFFKYKNSNNNFSNGKYVYVVAESFNKINISIEAYNDFKVFNYYNNNEYELIAIQKSNLKNVIQLLNFINIDNIKEKIEIKYRGIYNLHLMYLIYENFDYKSMKRLKFGNKTTNNIVSKSIKKIQKLKYKKSNILQLLYDLKTDDKSFLNKKIVNTFNTVTNLKTKYPLLEFVPSYRYSDVINDINSYIQAIDNNQLKTKTK